MLRKLTAVAVLGILCGSAAVADDAPKPGGGKFGKGGFDKGKLFGKLDANADGKLTKEELAVIGEKMAEKFKEKTGKDLPDGFGEKLFDRADVDGDGVLTKAEFENAGPPGRRGERGGKSDGKGPSRGEK
ncbi:MAG: EF-hand domain-containing protein [Fimbriiglobus sp.]